MRTVHVLYPCTYEAPDAGKDDELAGTVGDVMLAPLVEKWLASQWVLHTLSALAAAALLILFAGIAKLPWGRLMGPSVTIVREVNRCFPLPAFAELEPVKDWGTPE